MEKIEQNRETGSVGLVEEEVDLIKEKVRE